MILGLNFKYARWKNFLSTGNDWTQIDFDGAQTTLVIGENGSGKSTVLDVLCFGLFNKAFRKITKPQLLNSLNNKGLLTEISFTSGKDEFLVRRGMKPNIFEIEKNGEILNQDAAARDYQEVLEKYIIKMNYKAFCQVVILGSASFVPFMQLPAAHRREIIEDLLDIQIFTTMNLLLKDKISDNSRDLLDIDYKFELNNEKVKMHEEHMRSMLTDSQDTIREHTEKIESYQVDYDRELAIIDEKRVEQSRLISSTTNHDRLVKKMAEMHSLKHQLNDKINRLNEETTFFRIHDNCPTCKQLIGVQFKNDSIQSRELQVEETTDAVEKIASMYQNTEEQVHSLKLILNSISDINLDINIRTNKVKSIERAIEDLNVQISKINKKSTEYTSDNKTLKALESELNKIAEDKKELFNTREIHRAATSILKDNGIKAKLIKQYIPVINKLINKYLASMDFFVQFELDENFNETIKSRFRDVFSYSSFSEGEKSKIDLALLFTWRTVSKIRNSASTNILILDEVFDGSLDNGSSEELLKILIELSNDSNIVVISHKTDQLLDKFDRVIRFEKKQNFSAIATS